MKNIVGVKFKKEGKIYSFNAGDLPLKRDDLVVVSTENGPAVGTVAKEVHVVPAQQVSANLKNVIRMASDEDLLTCENNRQLEQEAKQFCVRRIAERQLQMKLIDAECLFDKSKMVFSFTAENRVDFRDLVKDLVQKFRTRIELRQIGARQEARIVKGLGICGREVCCATLLQSLDRVSVKMAKEQNMSLNPEKISGLCGRLMCCLGYEYDCYADLKKDMPKCGKMVQTPEGRGKVIRQSALHGEIVVALESGKEATFKVTDIQK
ncbi:MAG: stage 0 sporulation family protein [Deltaproteobacteria bacterium]|nr:stage 0 sporulation family protein [Deltaproteobacteria bacterium]MDA8126055.1 stage 0 sporulation family protein [Deltaproteobacteria bacterium]